MLVRAIVETDRDLEELDMDPNEATPKTAAKVSSSQKQAQAQTGATLEPSHPATFRPQVPEERAVQHEEIAPWYWYGTFMCGQDLAHIS